MFRDDADTLFRDLVRKAEMSAWLEEALKDFDAIANGVPASWHWLDGSARTLPLHIDLQAVKSRLMTRAGLDRGSK